MPTHTGAPSSSSLLSLPAVAAAAHDFASPLTPAAAFASPAALPSAPATASPALAVRATEANARARTAAARAAVHSAQPHLQPRPHHHSLLGHAPALARLELSGARIHHAHQSVEHLRVGAEAGHCVQVARDRVEARLAVAEPALGGQPAQQHLAPRQACTRRWVWNDKLGHLRDLPFHTSASPSSNHWVYTCFHEASGRSCARQERHTLSGANQCGERGTMKCAGTEPLGARCPSQGRVSPLLTSPATTHRDGARSTGSKRTMQQEQTGFVREVRKERHRQHEFQLTTSAYMH